MTAHYPNHPPYMPMIKWQSWERLALSKMDAGLLGDVRPCIEVRESDQHAKLLSELPIVWPGPALVDYADPAGRLTAARRAELLQFLQHPAGANPAVVPVLNPLDASVQGDAALRQAMILRGVVAYRWRTNLDANMAVQVPGLLTAVARCPTAREGTILIVDLGVTPSSWTPAELQALRVTLAACAAHGFAMVYLTSGAFPDSLAAVQTMAKLDRHDWRLWQSLTILAPELTIGYGDYGTLSPLWKESILKQGGGQTRSNIRYATTDHWLVLRGSSGKREECIAISELMTTVYSGTFEGRPFSYGDLLIADRANAALPKKDRHCGHYRITEAWNHHMTYVVRKQY
jgi:hypothetical protein